MELLDRLASLDEREVARYTILEYLRLVAQSIEQGAKATGGHTDRSRATISVILALCSQLNQPSDAERSMVITAILRGKQGAYHDALNALGVPTDDT